MKREFFPGSEFMWNNSLSPTTLGPADQLILDFAVIPWAPTTRTRISLGYMDNTHEYFWQINFEDGFVKDCLVPIGDPCPGALPYHPNEWNTVHAVLDIQSQTYTLAVNGASSGPFPFSRAGSDSFNQIGFLFVEGDYNGDEEDEAWIDEIVLTRSSPNVSSMLFHATFDDSPNYVPDWGSMTTQTPAPATLPASCDAIGLRLTLPTDKKSLAWSAPEVPSTYDVVSRRISGHFDGNFAAFTRRICGTPQTSYTIVPQGTPPAGSVDLWVIRQRANGVPGTWDEGGNQAQPRNVPYCP